VLSSVVCREMDFFHADPVYFGVVLFERTPDQVLSFRLPDSAFLLPPRSGPSADMFP